MPISADAARMNASPRHVGARPVPFTHHNRTHVAPPSTTTAEKVPEGQAILERGPDRRGPLLLGEVHQPLAPSQVRRSRG